MKQNSATHFLLSALVPYTKANLLLSYQPSKFFHELSKQQSLAQATLRTAYSRAIRNGLIELDDVGIPHLSNKALRLLRPYLSKTLPNSEVLVVFDIPESERWKRARLRAVLREFKFKPVQKSVLSSRMDCIDYLTEAQRELQLEDGMLIYEAKRM